MGTTNFKGYTNISEPSITEAIEDNVVEYINWGFLKLGAYYNISIPTEGTYGGNMHQLRSVSDPRYTNGQVWEANRKNWVWESGVNRSEDPIAISGVFVNDTFLPRGSGYHINYKYGQIIFDTAISTSSTVKLEYATKWIDTVNAEDVPWLRKTQSRSWRMDDASYVANSGDWAILAEQRLQMPVVAIEAVGGDYEGYQLGGGQYSHNRVIIHVIAENPRTATRLARVLADQSESTIFLYDPEKMAEDNRFPLDHRGEVASGALCYPDLVAATGEGGYRFTSKVQYGKMRIYDSKFQDTQELSPNVYHSSAQWSTEVILHKI
jgi:hypothetical protein